MKRPRHVQAILQQDEFERQGAEVAIALLCFWQDHGKLMALLEEMA